MSVKGSGLSPPGSSQVSSVVVESFGLGSKQTLETGGCGAINYGRQLLVLGGPSTGADSSRSMERCLENLLFKPQRVKSGALGRPPFLAATPRQACPDRAIR